jgi:GntR family transcriptional regulator
LRIIISNSKGIPIYEQIKNQIKEMILTSELKEGENLPSIRQLARDLRISVITTTRAYSELEQEGFIATMQGKGCFVLPRDSDMVHEQYLRRVEDHLAAAIADAKIAGIGREEIYQLLEFFLKEE